MSDWLEAVKAKANARKLDVVAQRNGGATFKAIGLKQGCTVPRARQLYTKGIELLALREAMKTNPILTLPHRAQRCLEYEGIESIEQLQGMTFTDLLDIPNCGRATADRILALLD